VKGRWFRLQTIGAIRIVAWDKESLQDGWFIMENHGKSIYKWVIWG
jgi:hypothetical protein